MFNLQSNKYLPHNIYGCKRRMYTYIQFRDTSMPNHHKLLCNNMHVLEHNGGNFGIERGVVDMALDGWTPPIAISNIKQQ